MRRNALSSGLLVAALASVGCRSNLNENCKVVAGGYRGNWADACGNGGQTILPPQANSCPEGFAHKRGYCELDGQYNSGWLLVKMEKWRRGLDVVATQTSSGAYTSDCKTTSLRVYWSRAPGKGKWNLAQEWMLSADALPNRQFDVQDYVLLARGAGGAGCPNPILQFRDPV